MRVIKRRDWSILVLLAMAAGGWYWFINRPAVRVDMLSRELCYPVGSEVTPDRMDLLWLNLGLIQPHSRSQEEITRDLLSVGSDAPTYLTDIFCRPEDAREAPVGYVLTRMGTPAVGPLTDRLSSSDTETYTRVRIAGVLGEIGPEAMAAVPALRNSLRDSHTVLRAQAAWALACIDEESARCHALPVMAQDWASPESSSYRPYIAMALVEIGDEDCPEVAIARDWLASQHP